MKHIKKFLWGLVIVLATLIGIYPISYLIADMSGAGGLLSTKPLELLSSKQYIFIFYTHILTGGLALLIGWIQFLKRTVNNRSLHRAIGKVYVFSVIISGISGLYISQYANGGIISVVGFSTLSILWIATTLNGLRLVKRGEIAKHKIWMLRSYSLAFAAVMLRIWMPIIPAVFAIDPLDAYKLVSWICWVPNLYVVELLIQRKPTYEIG